MAGWIESLFAWLSGRDTFSRDYHKPIKVNGKTFYRSANHYKRKWNKKK